MIPGDERIDNVAIIENSNPTESSDTEKTNYDRPKSDSIHTGVC